MPQARKYEVVCEFNDGKAKQQLYKEVPPVEQALPGRQFELLSKPSIRIYCSECELNLARFAHVISNKDYYCVPCFANLEVYPQDYLVRMSLRESPTDSSWDLFDELVMVHAFSLWGYSNWTQIKDYMDYNGSPFSLAEIQSHFEQYYYNQPGHFPPFPNHPPKAHSRPLHGENALQLYEQALLRGGQLKRRDSKGEKKISSMNSIPLESQSERVIKPPSAQDITIRREDEARHSTESPVLGYNPKRGEFQYIYYDSEAEKMLEELQFYQDDTPEQYQLKIKLIENYNQRLDQRNKRKQFTLQYKLLDSHYQFSQKPQEQRAASLFEPVMRFTAHLEEYRNLIGEFSTLAKYQKFITILNRIRRSVSAKGQISAALEYLGSKRRKSIQQWERAYNKQYKDKKRRKIHRRAAPQPQKDKASAMEEQPQQHLDFNFYQTGLLQFIKHPEICNPLLKITPLALSQQPLFHAKEGKQRGGQALNEMQAERDQVASQTWIPPAVQRWNRTLLDQPCEEQAKAEPLEPLPAIL